VSRQSPVALSRWRRLASRSKSPSKQSIVRGTMWIGGAAGITALTSLGIAVLLTRHFGPSRYGEYAALVAWAAALAVLTEGGLAIVLSQQIVRNPGAQGTLVRIALRRRTQISAVGTALAVLILSLAGQGRPSVLALASMLLTYQLDLALELPIAVWRAESMYKHAAFWRMARRTVYLGGTAIAVAAGADVQTVALVAVGTAIPLAVVANAIVLHATAGSRDPSARLPMTTSGLYWTSGVLYWIYFQADQVMLTLLADPAELGFYAPAVSALSISLALHTVVSDVLLPRLFAELGEKGGGMPSIRRRTLLQVPLFAAIAAIIWGGVTLAAPDLTRLVFGARFARTAPLLAILCVFVAIRFLSLPAVLALAAIDRMRTLVAVQGTAAAVNLAGNALLIGRMGAKGSAYATLVSEALLLIGTWSFLPAEWRRSAATIAAPHVLLGACLAATRLVGAGHLAIAVVLGLVFLAIEAPLLKRQITNLRTAA